MHRLDTLRDQYYWAQHTAHLEGFNLVMHSAWDGRMAMVTLPEESDMLPGAISPSASFLLNQQLLDILENLQTAGQELPSEQLQKVCLEASADAVRPRFAADALNDINTSYYLSDAAFDPHAGLASMYDQNRPLNLALGHLLATVRHAAPSALRVKELCSGNNTAHWREIIKGAMAGGSTFVDVTVTDFFAPNIHKKARTRHSAIHAEVCSLFDTLPTIITPQKRFDAMITTYGFDSMWLPGDMHVSRLQNDWYQTLYRVKVADWHSRGTTLLNALRQGRPLANATPADYDGIVVEQLQQPLDMTNHPYKTFLETHPRQSFNVPGGLVAFVAASFESQLSEHGIFVSFDMGNFGLLHENRSLPAHAKSGVAARYQPGEYVLVKEILEQMYGLQVRLLSLEAFVEHYLGADWRKKASDVEKHQIEHSPTNGVMIVERLTSKHSLTPAFQVARLLPDLPVSESGQQNDRAYR